jgi:hypothetical protein
MGENRVPEGMAELSPHDASDFKARLKRLPKNALMEGLVEQAAQNLTAEGTGR